MQIGRIDTYHSHISRELSNRPQPESTGFEEPFAVDLTGDQNPRLRLYGPGLPHNASRTDLSVPENNRSIDDDIVHAFYPVADINERLSSLLSRKDKVISQATRAIIDGLHIDEEATTPQQREEMRSLADAQARFIADNYLSGEDAENYMDIIGEIKSYADFSHFGLRLIGYTSLGQGGKAVYKPEGAPDGYVPASAALEMSDEKAFRQWRSLSSRSPEEMEALLSNMARYQKSAYKTLQENLHAVNESPGLGRLRALDTSSLESFSQSFAAAAPVLSASAPLLDSMARFLSPFLK